MAFTTNQTLVAEIAQATYGRALANTGLDFYANHLTAGTMTEASIMAEFMSNAEGAARYPAVADNAATVTQIFTNVLGRSPAQSGIDHYAALLAAGTMTKTQLVSQVLADAKGAAGDSTYISAQVTTADATYSGAAAGSDAASDAAAAKNDATAIKLTTGADVTQGTTGDDTFTAFVGTNAVSGANQDTISSIDIIDGGAGTDTLTFQQSGTSTNGATIANVENLVGTFFAVATGAAANSEVNMSNITGVSSFTNKGSIVRTDVSAIAAIMDLTVENINNQVTNLTYNASAVAGQTDVQKVTLKNATNGSDISLDASAAGTLETLALTSSGSANTITLGANTANTDALATTTALTVDGDQNLTVTTMATMAALKTITSTSTANVVLNTTASDATNMTATLGAGDDKITTAVFTKDDSYDMGAGNDTLVVTAATSVTTAANLAGIENIIVATAATTTLNLDKATELTTVGVGTGANVLTFTKAAASAQNLVFDTGAGTIGAIAYDSVVFGLKDVTGTTDTLNIVSQNTNALGQHVASTVDTQKTITAVTANGIENINITSVDMGANSNVATADSGLVITTLTSDKLQKLTIESDTLVTITNAIDNDVNTIDASKAAAGVTFGNLSAGKDASETTQASTTLDITTGAGNDTLTQLWADVTTTKINLGAGNDTLTLKADDFGDEAATIVDTITIDAGAGNDTIDVSASTTLAAEGTIAVTLGDGVDTIKIDGNDANQTGITVADFVVGSGGDKIDIATSLVAAATNATAYKQVTTWNVGTTAYELVDGLNIITEASGTTAASLSNADIATFLTGGANDITTDANAAHHYVMVTDGTDAAIALVDDQATAGAATIATGDVHVLLTLTGVSDLTKVTVDNFTDFLG